MGRKRNVWFWPTTQLQQYATLSKTEKLFVRVWIHIYFMKVSP